MIFAAGCGFHDDGELLFLVHFIQGKNGTPQHRRRAVQWITVKDLVQLSGRTFIVTY